MLNLRNKSYNILIGTPAYGGQVHTDYVKSILPLRSVGVNFNVAFVGNQALITRARNEIFSMFVSEKAKEFSWEYCASDTFKLIKEVVLTSMEKENV